tara:strand:+ start:507 stop:716 length:210 start_codon:yes stop_codon:yes gene_type:complete
MIGTRLTKKQKQLPPGAAPEVQGYWCAVRDGERKAPAFHPGHTHDWQQRWLKAYDEYLSNQKKISDLAA